MPSRIGLAAEVESSPRCSLIEATTSSTVTARPEWKVTPGRSLKRQVLASGVASQLSATWGSNVPSAAMPTR